MKIKHFFTICLSLSWTFSSLLAHDYVSGGHGTIPPHELKTLGAMHGEIDVDSKGLIYVSVEGGEHAGVQIYSADGKYLKNLKNAPSDFHGFVIHHEDGKDYLYGSRLKASSIVKMDLEGNIVMTIPGTSIPNQYKKKQKTLKLTSVDVAPNGDIYVVDGYGLDYIHRFKKDGSYVSTFAGRKAPWNFSNCHKIFIDTRFEPARILCCDRKNGRLVHLSLDGDVIGTYADELRRPSSLDFYGDTVGVAEIYGRVTLLDKQGKVTKVVSDNPAIKGGNNWPTDKWTEGLVITPHGITFDQKGQIWVSEFNRFGRTLKYLLKQ